MKTTSTYVGTLNQRPPQYPLPLDFLAPIHRLLQKMWKLWRILSTFGAEQVEEDLWLF